MENNVKRICKIVRTAFKKEWVEIVWARGGVPVKVFKGLTHSIPREINSIKRPVENLMRERIVGTLPGIDRGKRGCKGFNHSSSIVGNVSRGQSNRTDKGQPFFLFLI